MSKLYKMSDCYIFILLSYNKKEYKNVKKKLKLFNQFFLANRNYNVFM